MWTFPIYLLISLAIGDCLLVFPNNFMTVERNGIANLSCHGSREGVMWLQNGNAVQGGIVGASGELIINHLDQPDAGNYTCMRNGVVVAHTYLFITEEDKPPIFERNGVNCISRNFNREITCSWKTKCKGSYSFRVTYCRRNCKVKSECELNMVNYPCSGLSKVTFNVSSFSPYAEEYEPIDFTLEAINRVSYQSKRSSFYIRDIIKPDPPQGIKCMMNGSHLSASWEYPSEWPKPHSYFPLIFEISYGGTKKHWKIMMKRQEGVSIEKAGMHKRKNAQIYIRAKDKFLNSPWSERSYQKCNVQQ